MLSLPIEKYYEMQDIFVMYFVEFIFKKCIDRAGITLPTCGRGKPPTSK